MTHLPDYKENKKKIQIYLIIIIIISCFFLFLLVILTNETNELVFNCSLIDFDYIFIRRKHFFFEFNNHDKNVYLIIKKKKTLRIN